MTPRRKNINIEWCKEDEKNVAKIKISQHGEKQTFTITLYKGENSKKVMIQSKNVLIWKNLEYANLRELIDVKKSYKEIPWSETWINDSISKIMKEELGKEKKSTMEISFEIKSPRLTKAKRKKSYLKQKKAYRSCTNLKKTSKKKYLE